MPGSIFMDRSNEFRKGNPILLSSWIKQMDQIWVELSTAGKACLVFLWKFCGRDPQNNVLPPPSEKKTNVDISLCP